MKRDFNAPILKIDGTQFMDETKEGDKVISRPLTLKIISFMALTTPLQGDRDLAGEAKLKLYTLAHKVHEGGVVDLSSEDLVTLKDRIGRGFGVEVVGAAFGLLDADYTPVDPVAAQLEHNAAADRRDIPSGAPAAEAEL